MGSLIRLRTFSDKMSAETAKSFLETNGIMSMLSTDDAGGLRPELTLARGVKLWVNEEDEKEAVALLKEIENKKTDPEDPGMVTDPSEKAQGFLTRIRKWLSGD